MDSVKCVFVSMFVLMALGLLFVMMAFTKIFDALHYHLWRLNYRLKDWYEDYLDRHMERGCDYE